MVKLLPGHPKRAQACVLPPVLLLHDDWLCVFRRQTRTPARTQTRTTNKTVGRAETQRLLPTFSALTVVLLLDYRVCALQLQRLTSSHVYAQPFVPAAPDVALTLTRLEAT